jgi:integrase
MESYSAKIYVRDDYQKKDGSNTIYLRVTINRKMKKYSIGVNVNMNHWDKRTLKVKRGDLAHFNKNMAIESALKKANDIIYQSKIERKPLDFNTFEFKFYEAGQKTDLTFTEFALLEIEQDYKNKGSFETYRTRKSAIKKIEEFAGGKVAFRDIDFNFLKRLDSSMKRDGNSDSSRARILKTIKTFFNRAIMQDIVKENPVKKYKYKSNDGEREYLTYDELQKFEKLYHSKGTHKTLKKALKPFLFCCYTGLRYRDISELRFKNLKTRKEKDTKTTFISFIMHKTQKLHEIPLNNKAKALLPEKTFDEDKIFRVYTSQPMNRYLKTITNKTKVDKRITFHCSRHTFATLLLSSGTPIETVSKLLGHEDIKTTMIYARILPENKINAVNNLEKYFETVDK